MSVILFKLVNGKPEQELCDPLAMASLLKSGYSLCPEDLLNKKVKSNAAANKATKTKSTLKKN
jgi:hypothetical protein